MVVSIFAWVNGNPLILIHPTDTQGRICGLQYKDMNLTGKNSLFYFDVTKCTSAQAIINFQCPTTQICVSSCPNEYWTYYIEKAKLTAALVGTKAQRETAASLVDWSKLICFTVITHVMSLSLERLLLMEFFNKKNVLLIMFHIPTSLEDASHLWMKLQKY